MCIISPPNSALYLHDFVAATVESWPNNIAIEDGGVTKSYCKLDVESNQLAHLLMEKGCGPNERVCIFSSKVSSAYVGILGTLKSGACFVPLHFDYPDERLRFLLKSVQPKVIIAERSYYNRISALVSEIGLTTSVIDSSCWELASFTRSKPVLEGSTPEDLAYIIFTSGSTGVPKGVSVRHRNIVYFINHCFNFFKLGTEERFAHCSDFTFDPSIFDIFFCWATGGTLVPMNKRSYRINPFAFFRDKQVNVVFTVPSVISSIVNAELLGDRSLSSIRHLIFTGEALNSSLVNAWRKEYAECSVYNFYGTTETAIISHWYKVESRLEENAVVPVGYPLPGVKVTLMDEGTEVPQGEVGESVVFGSQICPGYWDNPTENQVRFKRIEGCNMPFQKAYYTGDLLVLDESGCYHYRGRKDRQVKVRGHRVELQEVEKVINGLNGVKEVGVVVRPESAGKNLEDIVAVILPSSSSLSADDVLKNVRDILPGYMCPSEVLFLNEPLPRNQNNKVDYGKVKNIVMEKLNV